MDDLDELYQDVILDHNRRPRNYRTLADANRRVEGHNPLCGDRLTLYIRLDADVIGDIGFQGSGCAISQASASLMTESVKGKRLAEVESLGRAVHDLLTGRPASHPALARLAPLAGVARFPVRVKCATLPWRALERALAGGGHVSTEQDEQAPA
jgi:nitrogen fixation NifU-like protein